MQISFSSHAVDRMIRQQISTVEVENLLAKPDGLIRQSKDKVIVYKRMHGRKDNALAAVVIERGGDFEVITVMVNFEVKK